MTELKILRHHLGEASRTARGSAQFWENLSEEDWEKLVDDVTPPNL